MKKVHKTLTVLAVVVAFLVGNGFNLLGLASEPHKVGNIKWAFTQEDQHPEQILIEMIDGAKESVDVAIYAITHPDIVKAIREAHKRGVSVRIITDKSQSKGDAQKQALKLFVNDKIPIKINKHSGLMHMKVTIVDGKSVTLGSFNYSKSAATTHDEVLMKIYDEKIAIPFADEFQKMWDDEKRFTSYQP